MTLARRQMMLIEIEWVVRDVKRSKQTKMFLSQVNSVITKACMQCISPSQGSGWSRRLTDDHSITLNPACLYPCIHKWNSRKLEGTGCFVPTCNHDIQQSRPDQACRFRTNKKTLLLFILLLISRTRYCKFMFHYKFYKTNDLCSWHS